MYRKNRPVEITKEQREKANFPGIDRFSDYMADRRTKLNKLTT